MKKIQKVYSTHKEQLGFKMDLEEYRKTSVDFNVNHNSRANHHAPLSHVFSVAAFMLSPLAAHSQCLINDQSIDVNRDGNPDLYFYFTSKTNNYPGAIRSVYQINAKAVNLADQISFFGTQFFPRSCYVYSCVFPSAMGLLSGLNIGSVGVLREQINSCQINYVRVKVTNTYTLSGNPYTSCYYFSTSEYDCNPVINNGNFEINTRGTLAFKFNNEDHFIELTSGPGFNVVIHKIDGAIAEPCDGGCQDDLELTCNEVFPIEAYKAENSILTNDIVDMTQMVELTAGAEIEMLPGFEVIQGGEFIAEINPNCN